MKVADVRKLTEYTSIKLVGARTGKTLCTSWRNKKETLDKYNDYEASSIYPDVDVRNSQINGAIYPIICIYVTGL